VAAPSLLPFPFESKFDALPLSQLLAIAQKLTRGSEPVVGNALVLGGQAPQLFRKHKHTIALLWLEGQHFAFNGFEPGKDWGYQDSSTSMCGQKLFFSMLLRNDQITVACAFCVPKASCVQYPILDGEFRPVYNPPSPGKPDRLWQSGLAQGMITVSKAGEPSRAFYAPFAGLEVGDLATPAWLQRP
jgi:hypothetical protein